MKRMIGFKQLAYLLAAIAVTGCFENNKSGFGTRSTLTSSSTGGTNITINPNSLAIANVTFTTSSSTTVNATTTANIFFDTSKSTSQISNYCSGQSSSSSSSGSGSSGALCMCNFSWVENNTTTGNAVPIQRGVQTAATTVQAALVSCAAPSVYPQIMNGTVINVSVVAGLGNGNTISMTPFPYTKSGASATGSFQDNQGNSFQNILRYSCYEQYQRGMTIASQIVSLNNPNSGAAITQTITPAASKFCVQKINGAPSTGTQCQGQLPNPDFSAQAYLFNLYIRDSEQGDINYNNLRYHCPTIKEALGNDGSVGTQNKAWPLDRTFSLSLGPTATFPVGVQAYTKLANGNDPVTANSSCYPSSTSTSSSSGSTTGSGNTLIASCLGFAAKPNSDGTCPYFRDSNNAIRFTYRLRRYIVLYPPIFDTDGQPLSEPQETDQIYVLDRPVNGPDPLKPYTMAGPKPCPFSFYDHNGVTGVADAGYTNGFRPGYYATNDSKWTGKNIDGIQFPNKDSANSCSAVIGLVNSGKTILSLGTVNSNNPKYSSVYVRPITAWAPHYIEDTSFQACAPQASPMLDPPLHFAKDANGNVGYCAEVYPSQNPNVASLDPMNPTLNAGAGGYVGDVRPFTSHVVKNTSSARCNDTALTLPTPNYPAGGLAKHKNTDVVDTTIGAFNTADRTCDRTVNSQPQDWLRFPLLAASADTESALAADISSYGCLLTYDNGGSKTGTRSPSGGCCGASVSVVTGNGVPSTAHLEPDVSCLTPSY